MKYSAATLLAVMAVFAKAQSESVPDEDAVTSIIGDVSSRIESAASEASNVASSVADDISSRIASLTESEASGASETVTETGTVTQTGTATDDEETETGTATDETETGTATDETETGTATDESGSVDTGAIASKTSEIGDQIASLSSKVATITDEAVKSSVEEEIAKATSELGALASSATEGNSGAMHTAAIAMGALMGGAAVIVNM